MAYDKEKLSRFENTILSETQDKIDQMQKEIDAYRKTELENAKQMEYDRMFSAMQAQVHTLQWKYRQLVTKASLEDKRKTLAVRNELAQKVFDKAEESLLAFADGAPYKSYLLDEMKKAAERFDFQGAVIYLRNQDMSFAEEIKNLFPIKDIQPDKTNTLGGFRVMNERLGLLLDETFQSKLKDQHEYFYQHCGLTVASEKG